MDFVHRSEFQILETTKFRKLDLFPSSGEEKETPTLLGPLESLRLAVSNGAQQSRCAFPLT
jgi:hypothetical protein